MKREQKNALLSFPRSQQFTKTLMINDSRRDERTNIKNKIKRIPLYILKEYTFYFGKVETGLNCLGLKRPKFGGQGLITYIGPPPSVY